MVSFLDVVEFAAAAATTHTLTGNVGDRRAYYNLGFSIPSARTISSVVGGGLVWTLWGSTSNGLLRVVSYRAFGLPSADPFDIVITLDDDGVMNAHVDRYDGVRPVTPIINEVTGSGTSNSMTVTISNTGYEEGIDMFINPFGWAIGGHTLDVNYTPRTNEQNQGAIRHMFCENNGSDNIPTHTKGGASNVWAMHGAILKAAKSIVEPSKLLIYPHVRM